MSHNGKAKTKHMSTSHSIGKNKTDTLKGAVSKALAVSNVLSASDMNSIISINSIIGFECILDVLRKYNNVSSYINLVEHVLLITNNNYVDKIKFYEMIGYRFYDIGNSNAGAEFHEKVLELDQNIMFTNLTRYAKIIINLTFFHLEDQNMEQVELYIQKIKKSFFCNTNQKVSISKMYKMRYLIGKFHFVKHEYKLAIQQLKQVNVDIATKWFLIGKALHELGLYEGAVKNLSKAVKKAPGVVLYTYALSICHLKFKNYPMAVETITTKCNNESILATAYLERFINQLKQECHSDIDNIEEPQEGYRSSNAKLLQTLARKFQ